MFSKHAFLSAAIGLAALTSVGHAQVVISTVYGGGGNTGSVYRQDYIELYNRGNTPQSLNGWSVQYASAEGSQWFVTPLGNVTLQPGQYYLVQGSVGTNGGTTDLPTPDVNDPTLFISSTNAKMALVNNITPLVGEVITSDMYVDAVGYGAGTFHEGASAAPATTNPVCVMRRFGGCIDTNNNGNDFDLQPPTPRNSTVAASPCGEKNLTLVVTDTPDPITALGTELTYTFRLGNVGSLQVDGVTITATFPNGVNFVSSTMPGVTFVGTPRVLTIPVGSVGPLSVLPDFTVNMLPTVQFPVATPLAVTFTANPTAGDQNAANNSTGTSTVVQTDSDLAVTVSSDQANCEVEVGSVVTYTVTVTNTSPNPATGVVVTTVLPKVMTFHGKSSATVGMIEEAAGVVTWTIGPIGPLGTAILTLKAEANEPGGLFLQPTVTSTSSDLTPGNNSPILRRNVPQPYVAGKAHKVIATSIGARGDPGQLNSLLSVPGIPLTPPNPLSPKFFGAQFSFSRQFFSPDGLKFVVAAETDIADTENTVIMVGDVGATPNFRVIAREGVTNFTGAPGDTLVIVERVMAINNEGVVAFAARVNPVAAQQRRLVVKGVPGATPSDPYIFTVIAIQGDPVPASKGLPGGTNWGLTFVLGGLMNDGTVAFSNTTSLGAAVNEVLVTNDGATLFVREGTGVPTGQLGGTEFPWQSVGTTICWQDSGDANWNTRGFKMTPDGQHYLIEGTIANTNTGQDSVVVKDGVVVAQEGFAFPGGGFTAPLEAASGSVSNFLESDGTWWGVFSNVIVPPAPRAVDFMVRDGVVVARTGDPIVPCTNEVWTDAVFGRTFTQGTSRGTDNIVGGLTSRGDFTIGNDPSTDAVLVWNGREVILREGDPVDLDDNPSTDDGVYAGPFIQNNRCLIGADRCVYIVVTMRTRDWACNQVTAQANRQAILRIPLPVAPCNLADIVGLDGNPPPDGRLGGEDFLQFMGAFAGGGLLADIVGISGVPPKDCRVGGEDFLVFLAAFTGGC